tara:strand:+ start:133 stop:282 length:150 start_codon:yes stop_codon:yes gene_type:complete
MFDDIWKEALIKAAPIMLLVISLTTIAVMPAYVMTGILVNQQNIQTRSN